MRKISTLDLRKKKIKHHKAMKAKINDIISMEKSLLEIEEVKNDGISLEEKLRINEYTERIGKVTDTYFNLLSDYYAQRNRSSADMDEILSMTENYKRSLNEEVLDVPFDDIQEWLNGHSV